MTWIKDIVKEMTSKCNTTDPYELASLKKIHVIPWDLHLEIKGFYKYDKRNKFIFINSNLDERLQRFVCAHELGHSQLHPRVNTPFMRSNTLLSVNRIEIEANRFAVELLMPDEVIREHEDANLTINEIASIYCVPNEVSHLKNLRNVR